MEEAVYTTASVTCHWAGAVMQKPLVERRKSKGGTDRLTDRQTDRWTERVIESRARDLKDRNARIVDKKIRRQQ